MNESYKNLLKQFFGLIPGAHKLISFDHIQRLSQYPLFHSSLDSLYNILENFLLSVEINKTISLHWK